MSLIEILSYIWAIPVIPIFLCLWFSGDKTINGIIWFILISILWPIVLTALMMCIMAVIIVGISELIGNWMKNSKLGRIHNKLNQIMTKPVFKAD